MTTTNGAHERRALQVTSLLSLIGTSIHMSQDTILQAFGRVEYPIPVVIFALWLYATLMMSDRLAGYFMMLFGGLIGAGMIMLHAKNGTVVDKADGLFFVWVLFALATTGWVTLILSARGIWRVFRARRAVAS